MKRIGSICLFLLFYVVNLAFGEESVEQLRNKALAGDSNAQTMLGEIYRRGEMGVATNYVEAIKWLNMAVSNKNPLAYYNVGCLLKEGLGFKKDQEKAQQFFKAGFPALLKGVENASGRWQYAVGQSFRMGYGIDVDKDEALKWIRKSAENGDAVAQFNMGLFYCKGEVVEKDSAEAFKWFEKASRAGVESDEESIKWQLEALAHKIPAASNKQADQHLRMENSQNDNHKVKLYSQDKTDVPMQSNQAAKINEQELLLTWDYLLSQQKRLTDYRWELYKKSLSGKQIKWEGKVLDVRSVYGATIKSALVNAWKDRKEIQLCKISMNRADKDQSNVEFIIPEALANELSKRDVVVFEGTIDSVDNVADCFLARQMMENGLYKCKLSNGRMRRSHQAVCVLSSPA